MLQMSYILAVSQPELLERQVSTMLEVQGLDEQGTTRGRPAWRFWRR